MNTRGILIALAAGATVAAMGAAVPPAAVAAAQRPAAAGSEAAFRAFEQDAKFSRSLRADDGQPGTASLVAPRAGLLPPFQPGAVDTPPQPPPGIDRPAVAGTASCTEPNCDLPYNGGAVQHTPHVYILFWGPTWQTNTGEEAVAVYLEHFFTGLGQSDDTWSAITSQYGDTTGYPAFGTSDLVSYGYDTSAPPATVQDADLAAEAATGAHQFGITDVADAQVIVAAQSGTCFADGFAGSSCQPVPPQYCGWHSATTYNNADLAFINLPYQLDAKTDCGENFVNSGTAGTDDGFSIVAGHEYAETVTDPDPDSGWIDTNDTVSGGELADKCAWGGQIWGTSDPAGDITLSTGSFAMQSLWSNAAGGCVMSNQVQFSITALGNQTSALGAPVSVQVHASTTPATTLTYTATGLPSGLLINSATGHIHGAISGPVMTYTPTVTVSSSAGSHSFSFTWTADAVGAMVGAWSKCADDSGGKAVGGNKIQLWSCVGGSAQKFTFTPGGQLQVEGGCVTGSATAFWEPCNAATNKVWTRTLAGEYVNQSSGQCLTDPNLSKTSGVALTVSACKNTAGQHWSLP